MQINQVIETYDQGAMDYDELIYNSKLAIEVLADDRIESPNPFLCGCQLLLKNSKA